MLWLKNSNTKIWEIYPTIDYQPIWNKLYCSKRSNTYLLIWHQLFWLIINLFEIVLYYICKFFGFIFFFRVVYLYYLYIMLVITKIADIITKSNNLWTILQRLFKLYFQFLQNMLCSRPKSDKIEALVKKNKIKIIGLIKFSLQRNLKYKIIKSRDMSIFF